MRALVGQEIGPSEWRTVTQEDIDTFAKLSGDDQWIHVDVERAKRTARPVPAHSATTSLGTTPYLATNSKISRSLLLIRSVLLPPGIRVP